MGEEGEYKVKYLDGEGEEEELVSCRALHFKRR